MAGGGVWNQTNMGFLETILLKSFEVFSMKLVWMKKKKKKLHFPNLLRKMNNLTIFSKKKKPHDYFKHLQSKTMPQITLFSPLSLELAEI